MPFTFKNIFLLFLLLALAYSTFLMGQIIFNYIPIRNDAAFLQIKQDYIHIPEWRLAFFVHVFSSILVLFAGFTQFNKKLLRQKPKLHRVFGYIYVIDILLVTGPASLLMAFYANGGPVGITAFVLLAVLWLFFTAMAWYKAVKKDFTGHKKMMIRSYALTLSAITLRIWKIIIMDTTTLTLRERYQLIAWLGFVINLLVAELIIFRMKKGRTPYIKQRT